MTDQEILKKIGLTDHELRDLQAKHAEFAKGLNAHQKKSLAKSLPTSKEAAATLGPGVTPERLEEFIRERAPHADALVVNNKAGSAA